MAVGDMSFYKSILESHRAKKLVASSLPVSRRPASLPSQPPRVTREPEPRLTKEEPRLFVEKLFNQADPFDHLIGDAQERKHGVQTERAKNFAENVVSIAAALDGRRPRKLVSAPEQPFQNLGATSANPCSDHYTCRAPANGRRIGSRALDGTLPA
jgi:hypothetical protein